MNLDDLEVQPSLIDHLADLPALAEPMKTIQVAIDLLTDLTHTRQDFPRL
jgi:hypothetical protein